MATLNWIGKDAVVNHDKEVPFKLLEKSSSTSVGKESKNLIVHGDNLEALKALMPFYKGKVKCVYIDPPYNTGNEDWRYNDNVNSPKIREWIKKAVGREGEDLTRHDKWLCMMYPRLKLLRELLSDDGAIFVSIDDNEHHNLRLLLDEIFGEKCFVGDVIWQHSIQPKGYTDKFSVHHNYTVCYSKSSSFILAPLARTDEHNVNYKNPDNDPRGPWRTGDVRNALYRPNLKYEITTPSGKKIAPPENGWRWSKETIAEKIKTGEIFFNKDETRIIHKIYLENVNGRAAETIWFGKDVGTTRDAAAEIKELFGKLVFETPKPTGLIRRILEISTNDGDLILDSFAGSGTTAHAVMQINSDTKSTRNFILVEMDDNVAKKITAERVKKAIKKFGYKDGFEYCELQKPLFNEKGQINEQCTYQELATYVYFTETHTNAVKKDIRAPFIGASNGISYYLLYKEKNKNDLTREALAKLKITGPTVIYADRCLVDEDELVSKGITFKQIPYEIKIY